MRKNERESFEKRSPLQRLNGLQIRKPNCKKPSNLSSSSVSFEAPNGCSRLLLSSNSSSATSSPSSSRTHFHRMPKNLSIVTAAVTLKPRSKENELPKKPFSQKSMKSQPPCLDKKQYGKAKSKPTYKNAHRSQLCSAQGNRAKIFKKGSEKMEAKLKSSEENSSGELPIKLFEVSNDINLDWIENCTPEGKIASVCGLDSVSFDYSQNLKEDPISKTANGKNSDNAVKKTPPVEASVSPEIQSVFHSKILIAKSAATPVCYGAGHLLSGVTDKRKCRRRGSLKGGCEKINLFDDEKNYENLISDSRDSLVPLPGEASVHWVLSPCDEGREDSENRLDQCEMIGESGALLLSSPSMLCKNVSDFGCDNNSALSLGSLSSGNIIQTPSWDSSSYGCLGGSNMDFVQFDQLDSITKTLNKVGLSPPSDLSSITSLTEVQENVNSVCSWFSDSTLLDNLALSQTRISWRDGFVSRIDENDEFDCCRCLSDEEIDGDVCSDKQLCPISGSRGDKENDLANNGCLRSCLGTEYESCVFARGKEKLSPHGLNASAESICTNGGELLASGDSDWMYFRENHLFRVK